MSRPLKFIGNPLNLLRMSFRYGMDLKYVGRFLIYLLKAIFFFPFYLIESLGWSKAYSKTKINKPPVFIVGHHRSGTTLIHKLLATDPSFCFFKNSEIIFPLRGLPFSNFFKRLLMRVIVKLKVKTFAYNNVLFDLNDPQEEDMCLAGTLETQTFYWAFVFPGTYIDPFQKNSNHEAIQRWKKSYDFYLKRIQFHNKEKRLLLKNPPNTARVAALLEMFPNAKFIYINRETRDVIYSALRLWKKGLQAFSLQKFDEPLIEEKVFHYYKKFYSLYHKDKELIDPANLVEINYEDLLNDPLIIVQKIYEQFGWSFSSVSTAITDKVLKEKKYKTFEYVSDDRLNKKISELEKEVGSFADSHQHYA